ncbi:MAG: A/G-specific adenine glycosylase [Bacteroidetes bacterium MedPE-SWsnd-G2]|nr:MAG: A/G-specific adenine glycosylase [Bacteroidetes bacterium MedPE-SWsnd-G2]
MKFSSTITNWYSINKRDLPWRHTTDPYQIWLSEIILQQTQVKQGLPYFRQFLTHFPTIFDLANATEEEVLNLWQGLGYYSRARNLHFTAKQIVSDFNGKFPNTYKELLKLKGVGDYTASAVASICFNEVTAVVDGNVYRVLSRFYGISTPINSTEGNKQFKTLASHLIDPKHPALFNQAIMEYGARMCKPKAPDCIKCPLQTGCVAYQTKSVEKLPVKLKKTKVTKKHFSYLVFLTEDNHTIFQQRTGKGIWQNLYQFPLIESSKKLNYVDIKSSEVFNTIIGQQEFEISLYNKEEIIHKLSHQHLHTHFYIIRCSELYAEKILYKIIKEFPAPTLIANFITQFENTK